MVRLPTLAAMDRTARADHAVVTADWAAAFDEVRRPFESLLTSHVLIDPISSGHLHQA